MLLCFRIGSMDYFLTEKLVVTELIEKLQLSYAGFEQY